MFGLWFGRRKLQRNELKNVFENVSEIYQKNMWAALNDKNTLSNRLLGKYQDYDVNHIFLWGIYSKILESFPTNPKIPDNGIKAHMIYFFIVKENITMKQAAVRVNELEKIKESGNYMMDNVIKFGRSAISSEANDFLIMCHCAFANKKYFDETDQSGPWNYAVAESMKRDGVFS